MLTPFAPQKRCMRVYKKRALSVVLDTLHQPPVQARYKQIQGLPGTVRSPYKRRLIQLNIHKSGLHGLEWKTRDPYSLVNDSLITRTHCTWSQVFCADYLVRAVVSAAPTASCRDVCPCTLDGLISDLPHHGRNTALSDRSMFLEPLWPGLLRVGERCRRFLCMGWAPARSSSSCALPHRLGASYSPFSFL